MSTASNAKHAPARSAHSADARIHHDIAEAIFDQRMPPGTRLSEARLGALYDVSRTVVRKALFGLAADRLVDMRPNRGAMVARPTVTEAHDVFEARRVIESALLAESLPRLTRADHDRLHALAAADRAAHDQHDRRATIRASGDFHLGLARMAGNSVLLGFLEQLVGRTSLIIAIYQSPTLPSCSAHAHEALVAIIASGDIDAAQRALCAHLTDCERQLCLTDTGTPGDLEQMLHPADTDT